jgi:hypothetical protein
MTKARRRRSNLPKPAPFPADEAPREEEAASQRYTFEEPVFEDEAEDERFAARSTAPLSDRRAVDSFDEPVFEEDAPDFDESPPKAIAVGSAPVGAVSTSAQNSSTIQSAVEPEEEYRWNEADSSVGQKRGRRLGRTAPFWLMGSGLALVLLIAFWSIFLRGGADPVDRQLTPVAAGLVGSAPLSDTAGVDAETAVEPTPEPVPTATPVPILTAGQVVVVANTAGAGIRLRNQPGTGGLTLAIYPEGESFTVLNPDGDYSSYPVEVDGYRWYRIQIANNPDENLTGWAAGDFLVASE